MKRKGWFIPIAVFFMCTWFLIMYEQSTNEPYLAHTSNLAQLPWDKDISEIQRVYFSAHSSSFTAERVGNDWSIVSPIESDADSTYIYNVISQFTIPGLIHTIETGVTNPSSYGIFEYSPCITLIDQAESEYTLIAGNAASETTSYVYSPLTQCVYTIKTDILNSVSSDLSDWRSKDYITFVPEQTSKIDVITAHTTYSLLPNLESTDKPFVADGLSPMEVEDIINFLTVSKVSQFIVDHAPTHIISSYGFNTPTVKIKLYDLAGNAQTLSFVKIPNSINYYVLDHSKGNIYKV
ncbi:MAG: DUF4340 domain-containing protein [Niameybacter sp.]|uniref:DUF4340 domain-containing protein n=1 Tax=Niameybacter sp. TaxID=2033640 RepID=UPI002FC7F648